MKPQTPNRKDLLIPTLRALETLGGSGTIEEINEAVYVIAEISDDILAVPHSEDGVQSEVDYELAWSRTYLKKAKLIDNSSRGIWALAKSDIQIVSLTIETILELKKENSPAPRHETKNNQDLEIEETNEITDQVQETTNWKEDLLNVLLNIQPDAFERLAQRLLRESGFTQVEVTGKVGDGGIDGKGIVRINGFLSFHVIFQCKRYRGSVTPDKIRDFRGAMQGRADKGLFITTGTFTRESIKEATRDGAPPIDLIDGELLCDKLKELKLGISTKTIETVEINSDWFNNI